MSKNGKAKNNYKGTQKNVSVYLGLKGGWQERAIAAICRKYNVKESELLRGLFLQKCADMGLYDADSEEPDIEKIDLLLKSSRKILPSIPTSLEDLS